MWIGQQDKFPTSVVTIRSVDRAHPQQVLFLQLGEVSASQKNKNNRRARWAMIRKDYRSKKQNEKRSEDRKTWPTEDLIRYNLPSMVKYTGPDS